VAEVALLQPPEQRDEVAEPAVAARVHRGHHQPAEPEQGEVDHAAGDVDAEPAGVRPCQQRRVDGGSGAEGGPGGAGAEVELGDEYGEGGEHERAPEVGHARQRHRGREGERHVAHGHHRAQPPPRRAGAAAARRAASRVTTP
jgi:hypothetical protein